MPYVDGFLLPLPKRNVKAYLAMARTACRCGWSTARSSTASASART
jgi:hypothetical protein